MRFAMCDARSVVVIDGALGTKSLQKEKKKNLPPTNSRAAWHAFVVAKYIAFIYVQNKS
jgi:hypothetical protein